MGRIWWWMGGSVVFRVGGSVRLQGGTFARVEDWNVDTLWARSTKLIWEGEFEALRVSNTLKTPVWIATTFARMMEWDGSYLCVFVRGGDEYIDCLCRCISI